MMILMEPVMSQYYSSVETKLDFLDLGFPVAVATVPILINKLSRELLGSRKDSVDGQRLSTPASIISIHALKLFSQSHY